jgi:hypothetical protein
MSNPCLDAAQLNALLKASPLANLDTNNAEHLRWLAQTYNLAKKYLDSLDGTKLNVDMGFLGMEMNSPSDVGILLHRALANAEAKCGGQSLPTGTVVNPGQPFKAFSEIAGVLRGAQKELFIVDPYMNDTVLSQYALAAPEGVSIKLLSREQKPHTDLLRTACLKWQSEYASKRPLEARLTHGLHDRVIFIDKVAVWQLSQSIKDFGVNATATVIPLDNSLLADKLAAYDDAWNRGVPL